MTLDHTRTGGGLGRSPIVALFLALLVLTASGGVGAATAGGPSVPVSATKSAWPALSRQQQQDLLPLQKDWASLSADRQQKWLEVAARMPFMTDEERERVRERMAEWARMTPAQRGQARLQFQEVRQWPSEDRQARWEAYLALSEQERAQLAGQAHRASAPQSDVGTGQKGQLPANSAKSNPVIPAPSALGSRKTVAPTVVQIRPGATTQLVSRTATPPAHHQPGMPKIAASAHFVDPMTLLPKRGPQAAAMAASAVDPAPQP